MPGPQRWLLIGRRMLTGEHKYFLSNAPADTPLEQIIHVIFARWHIQRIFEEAKSQVGLDHFRSSAVSTADPAADFEYGFAVFSDARTGFDARKKIYPQRAPHSSGARGAAESRSGDCRSTA